MFKFFGLCIKVVFFSTIVLVVGNIARIGDHTVSDYVRMGIDQVSDAQIPEKLHDWANAQPTIPSEKSEPMKKSPARNLSANTKNSKDLESDEITPNERKKLKAIIEEMNR